MRGKKSVAVLTAVLMGIGTMSTGVYAADSYKETEKAAFQKALQEMTAQYGEELAQYDTLVAGQAANLTLTVEDAGRAILGMIAPVDVSWLGDVSLSANVSMADKKTTEMMDVLVNGAKICSLEYYLDMETMDVYMRIPELNEGFIRMNMTESAELAAQQAEELKKSAEESGEELPDTASAEAALKEMRASLAISSNMREILPEAAIAESILNRYGTILLDSVTDGVSGTEVLNASGISQECKVLEGSIPAKDAVPMLQEILSTAKADEELKAIIEAWTEASEDENVSYAAFIDAIEKQEAELEGLPGQREKKPLEQSCG